MATTAQTNGIPKDESNGSTKLHKDNDPGQRFLGEQPYGMPNDLVVPKIMDLDNSDERLWVRKFGRAYAFLDPN